MSRRVYSLAALNPSWVTNYGGAKRTDAVMFNCPEGHVDCKHVIPFTPSLEGHAEPRAGGGAQWDRTGDTLETLTLSPSIRRIPRHASREAAIASGCIPEYIDESLLCAFHGHVTNGAITFEGDSY